MPETDHVALTPGLEADAIPIAEVAVSGTHALEVGHQSFLAENAFRAFAQLESHKTNQIAKRRIQAPIRQSPASACTLLALRFFRINFPVLDQKSSSAFFFHPLIQRERCMRHSQWLENALLKILDIR